jgi:glycosyltransferase involved in cell wall biosynthesis
VTASARTSPDRLRVLVITKIFPNAVEPLTAPFNRQQFAALGRRCDVEVLASIPWFPGASLMSRWSSAGKLSEVPRHEQIDGLTVHHPRTLFVPRGWLASWGPLYAASIAPVLRRYRGAVDVVLGSWAYPDGFAAVVAGELLGVPSVVKVHGSDVNVVAKVPGARRMAGWALPRASRVVAVSRALGDEVVALGVDRARVAIVMNGVDAALFQPRDRAAARAALDLPADGPLAVYVGNLKPIKGVVDLAIAFGQLLATRPTARLAIVGGGPERAAVEAALGPARERVVLAGPRPLDEIPRWMAAADVLVLPSWNEGTPNVVLEALACGRRVLATAVGGVPDLLTEPALGVLVPPRDPTALAAALATALDAPGDPAAIAALGSRGGWAASAAALHDVLRAATEEGRR